MAGSRLEAQRRDILHLVEEGYSQTEIIKHFKERGITIPRSTLSDFLRQQGEADIATATLPMNGHTLPAASQDTGQAVALEAMMRFQRSIADVHIDKMVEVIEALQTLKTEGDERHTALLAATGNLRMTPPPSGEVKQALDAAILRLDRLAARTAGAGLRWVWFKASLLMGITCAIGFPLVWEMTGLRLWLWPLVKELIPLVR